MPHAFSSLPVRQAAACLLMVLVGFSGYAQTPAWQQAVAVGSGEIAEVTAMATDASGNLYLTGNFQDSLRVGSTRLVSAGGFDIFVAKWNTASNSFVWAKRAGSGQSDYAKALAVSGSNVYVVGSCGEVADFGGTTLTTPANTRAAFVTRLTDAGPTANFTWTQGGSGSYDNVANALAVSGPSVYVAGTFGGVMTGLGGVSLTSAGSSDAYVIKLTDTGAGATGVWAQRAGGTNTDAATKMTLNGPAVYVTGEFSGTTATFGATTLNASPSNPGNSLFVAKLADAGSSASFVWALKCGGSSVNKAGGIGVRGVDVYLAGDYYGPTATFGTTTLSNVNSSLGYDGFVVKIVDGGTTANFGWAQPIGGTQGESVNVLVATSTGLYVGLESSSSSVSFGGNPTVVSGNAILLTRLVDAGATSSFAWVQQGGGFNGRINALTVQGSKLYVGGMARTPANFGSQVITAPTPSLLPFFAFLTDASGLPAVPSVLSGIGLSPNPAHGRATIQLPAIPGATTATLTLLDALGRTLRTQTAGTNAKTDLDLTGLPAGLYAVRVQAGGSTATQRLVVE